MTSEDFVMEICSFFARNPEEELTVEDAAAKWDVEPKDIHNWKRRFESDNQFIRYDGGRSWGLFTAGPALREL